jgi:predicted TIM-barrel fold metal-dependent hydrolase
MGRYGYWVVDGDGHVAEPEAMWPRFLPPKFRDAAPRVITDNRGVKRVLVDGWFWTTPPGRGVGHPGGFIGGPRVDRYAGGSDPKARLADMDTEGIDVAVLYATVTMGPSSGVLPSGDVEFEGALCQAYNSWVAEYASTDRARLRPVAVLPTRDIPAAVAELHRCVERLGFVGAELPTNSAGVRYPGDPYFDPIWEAAQALGVPVVIHPHAGGQIDYVGRDRFDNFFHGHMIAFPFEQMIAAMHVVTGGVLERFPRLRLGFLESGIGWVPYWFERMDEHYAKLAHLVPELKRAPGDWARDPRVIFSCDPDEETLPLALELLGDTQVMYASDYPHWDAMTPLTVKIVAERGDLGEEAKRKLLGENARRFYALT